MPTSMIWGTRIAYFSLKVPLGCFRPVGAILTPPVGEKQYSAQCL